MSLVVIGLNHRTTPVELLERMAVPSPEHFDPLFFVVGATDERDRLETLYEGFEYGNLSMRTIAFTPDGGLRTED